MNATRNNDLFAILGSGFGLYGYLPALSQCGWRAVLPERYRPKLLARPELSALSQIVEWAANEEESLRIATGAVLALRPENQETWLYRCLALPHLNRLIVEKPLARTPASAQAALDALQASGKDFRIGYLFGLTSWGRAVTEYLVNAGRTGKLAIRWHFFAHHYRHNLLNWKRDVDSGGGAMRFFGIHLIALLGAIGYKEIVSSRTFGSSANDIEAWHAVAVGPGLPECEISVESRSDTSLLEVLYRSPEGAAELHRRLAGPFDSEEQGTAGVPDSRIRYLTQICATFSERSTPYIDWYRQTARLWTQAETRATFQSRAGR